MNQRLDTGHSRVRNVIVTENRKKQTRFPRRLYELGTEPDPRYSLANERTFLSWIGAGLALLAAGVALAVLARDILPGLRVAAALVLIVAGVATPVQAWFGWLASERAMRLGKPLPSPVLAGPIAMAVVVAGVLLAIGYLL
jgi:putative membrane protein